MSESSYTVCLVPPEHCRREWSRVRDFLIPAIKLTNGRWNEAFVLASLVLNEQSLWIVLDKGSNPVASFTTEVVKYPLETALSITFIGGIEYDLWIKDMVDVIEKYAKDLKCGIIEVVGRLGFWKRGKEFNFEKSSTFYEKRIQR